jgi:glycosyltransferase involved in cell wall biosynthesis
MPGPLSLAPLHRIDSSVKWLLAGVRFPGLLQNMNILFNIHAYVPHWNAGAEKSFHDLAKSLIRRGHDVKVIVPFLKDYEHEGVKVYKEDQTANAPLWRAADIVFTQLNCTGITINLAKYYGKKVVHFARNDNNYDMIRYRVQDNFIVYNSEWVKKSLAYPLQSFVMPPIVDYRYYDIGDDPFGRKYITLINHNENKGANQVIEIAKRMPEKQFLFIDGGYGDQITADLPNLTVWHHQKDIREVYKVTRILLMPSKYESWGRTCTEAMCNGIPVVHSYTPGLLENTAYRQMAAERYNTDDWITIIEALDNPEFYKSVSASGRFRAKELDPEKNMDLFEAWLTKIVGNMKSKAA